MQDFKHFNRLL